MSEKKMVAIACSTGGPKALQTVIAGLPENLEAPVVIVQHMPSGFTASMAERLNDLCAIPVKEAEEGDILENGQVYIARGGRHLSIARQGCGDVIHITDEPAREGVKPCANVMYEALCDSSFDKIVCVVMTGMGADGTKGIEALRKEKKVYVITQDEASCTIYGMPKSIVQAGMSDKEVPLDRIAYEIQEQLKH